VKSGAEPQEIEVFGTDLSANATLSMSMLLRTFQV